MSSTIGPWKRIICMSWYVHSIWIYEQWLLLFLKIHWKVVAKSSNMIILMKVLQYTENLSLSLSLSLIFGVYAVVFWHWISFPERFWKRHCVYVVVFCRMWQTYVSLAWWHNDHLHHQVDVWVVNGVVESQPNQYIPFAKYKMV